jgi:cytoskeleton protein RodZ
MADFGGKLREARERRGVSLRQIAGTTKISVPALEALERNDPSRLPGGIFSRALVRSYASEVGLDPEATVREFLLRFDLDPRPLTLEATAAEQRERSGQRLASGVVLKIIVASLAIAAIILILALARSTDHRSTTGAPADNSRRTSRRGPLKLPTRRTLPVLPTLPAPRPGRRATLS